MYYRVRILYQTSDGRYETFYADHAVYQLGRDAVVRWALNLLPASSRVVSYHLEWKKGPTEDEALKKVLALFGLSSRPETQEALHVRTH